jgi:hypothetical protein
VRSGLMHGFAFMLLSQPAAAGAMKACELWATSWLRLPAAPFQRKVRNPYETRSQSFPQFQAICERCSMEVVQRGSRMRSGLVPTSPMYSPVLPPLVSATTSRHQMGAKAAHHGQRARRSRALACWLPVTQLRALLGCSSMRARLKLCFAARAARRCWPGRLAGSGNWPNTHLRLSAQRNFVWQAPLPLQQMQALGELPLHTCAVAHGCCSQARPFALPPQSRIRYLVDTPAQAAAQTAAACKQCIGQV